VGDVVVAIFKGLETGGICVGINCAFARIGGGLTIPSRECIVRAWRI
ncbi:MAG: hypothetical protein JWP44_4888, partial [Mucilaginibacter sp.]|nr:hypothetical protein [Mucilaginibacter sp.]